MRRASQFPKILFLGIFSLAFPERVQACSCGEYFTPPCAAYWRADAVFIGTVLEIGGPSSERNTHPLATPVHFQVEKSFKGFAGTQIVVDAFFGSCYDRSRMKIKEPYLVYAERNKATGRWSLSPWPCARFIPVTAAESDLNYITKLIRKEVPQSISGMLEGLAEDDLKSVRIVIKGDKVNVESSPKLVMPYTGHYDIKLPQAGTFSVKLILPFELRSFFGGNMRQAANSSQTILEYSVSLAENECDYKEMKFVKANNAKPQ